MPGPLPTEGAARRNAPTVPSSSLPVSGREGPAPACPVELGDAGSTWWTWAWATPQALGWSDGDLYFIGHRAQLEDDLGVLSSEDFGVLDEFLSFPEYDAAALLGSLVNRLKALTTGKTTLLTRINDMDDKLGLTPKGLAQLRWKIVPDEAAKIEGPTSKRRDLKLVDRTG